LRTTGYGAIERCNGRVRLVEAGVVAPPPSGTLEQRLRELYSGICEVLAATQPHLVVIEELYTTYKNPRSALIMGHARGVLCLASAQAGVPVHSLGHARVKRALVGSGSARKEQVGAMVTRLLKLRRPPSPHDVSDALALALAFLNVHDRAGFANVR
jgi:crossover junction endodeoxyribonuclease RuvC